MSKATKHTPGPWVVHPIRAEVNAPVIGEDGDLLPVCKLLWPTTERTEEETLANAELIAAAPDLYRALEELVHTELLPNESMAHYARRHKAIADAVFTLAKARGEKHD